MSVGSGIKASVGRGGANIPTDVLFIQNLINQRLLTPLRWLVVDGRCGPLTIFAIEEIQRVQAGMKHPSGIVVPDSPTFRVLTAGGAESISPRAATMEPPANRPALVPLSSSIRYTVATPGPNTPEVHAVFSPATASRLDAAFAELNKLGIVPQVNSAFRTPEEQAFMQCGGSGSNPAAKVSWHEAGAAVDINGTTSPQFRTIKTVMKKHRFKWGGEFHSKKDPPHFDGRLFSGDLKDAVRKAQASWNSTNK